MWRYTTAALVIGGLFGCMSVDTGPETGGPRPHWGTSHAPPSVPGLQGPYGSKVPMVAPYSYAPPPSQWQAQQMMNNNMPMNMLQFNQGGGPGPGGPGMPPLPTPPGGYLSPPGVPFAPGAPSPSPINPASYQGGGGMGVVPANIAPGAMMPGGVMQAQYAPAAGVRFPAPRTQVRFGRPAGMKVYWYTMGADGKPTYSTTPVETPGRYNFAQSAIYRLKLSNIEGRPGLELYPTMEVVPSNPKTDAFLAHNAVPIDFTAEDFKQVAEGNYIVKVIYLPDPQFQDAAGTGIDEILSTRLEPGQDPIQEALRRGSILLVIRMGNVDQEAPNTPPLVTPAQQAAPLPPQFGAAPFGPQGGMPPFGPQGGMPPQFGGPQGPQGPTPPLFQVPMYGMPNQGPKFGPNTPLILPPGPMPPGFPGMPPVPAPVGADPRGALPQMPGPWMAPGGPMSPPALGGTPPLPGADTNAAGPSPTVPGPTPPSDTNAGSGLPLPPAALTAPPPLPPAPGAPK